MTILMVTTLVLMMARRYRQRNRRQSETVRRCLPEVVDLVIAALRAGHTPARAMTVLAVAAPDPVRGVFKTVVAGLEQGEAFTILLRHAADGLGADYRPLCDVLAASERLGIPTETMIVQLSADAHLLRRLLAEADARRLPIRLSLPLVCCTLPSFVVLVIVPVIAGTLTQLHITP
ncbi:MAG: type II secretion system F family protein [Ilumatobacteraceae bacterium]